MMFTKTFLLDAGERVVATFVEAAVGSVILAGALNLDVAKAAGLAGTLAALTVIKSLAAKFLGDKQTAAALPLVTPNRQDLP